MGLYLKTLPYIKFPENFISINGESPTLVKLANLLGIQKRRLQTVLRELEYMEVIKIVKNGRNNIIYFNPFLLEVVLK